MASLSLYLPLLLLAFMVQNGETVRCWTCSSDINPACNDPFLISNDSINSFKLVNCDLDSGIAYPYLSPYKSVCKKQKTYTNGELVTLRGCTWKSVDDNSTTCMRTGTTLADATMSSVKRFCETCDYDGCNGATIITAEKV